jgi:hypothetical protein
MTNIYKILCFLLISFLGIPSAFGFTHLHTQKLYQLDNNNAQCGQSLSDKKLFTFNEVQAQQEYCLLLEFDISTTTEKPQLLFISALASTEIFLDGKPLAANGQAGNNLATEIPGNIEFWVNLPAQLTIGRHQLILKMSTYHAPADLSQYFYGAFIRDQNEFFQHKQLNNLFAILLAGGLALVALIFLILVFSIQRQAHWLIFCLLCASASCLLIIEVWRNFMGYAYPLHVFRLYSVLLMADLFSLLLPLYFLLFYKLQRILWWFIAIVIFVILIAIAPMSFDGKVYLTLSMALVISVLINLLALKKQKPGSITGFIISLLSLILNFWQSLYFTEQGFALIVCLLLLSLLYQLIQQFRDEKAKAAMAIQLENQLLHKSLQPHFLMNSLTLISELIQHSPEKSEQFIQALAVEFRLLNIYVGSPSISLLQELELCRNYLDMINIRQSLDHQLNVEGDCTNIKIPPALLLTLLENTFSHNKYQEAIQFTLTIIKQPSRVKLSLTLPVAEKRLHEGIGIGNSYIEQSLRQVFSNQATYAVEQKENLWLAKIELPL